MSRRHIVPAAVVLVLLVLWVLALSEYAGSTDPTNPPGSTSSYTLEDIYNRLNGGTPGTPSIFSEPGDGPGTGTMYTLNEIMSVAPTKDESVGATRADVLDGRTFWGLTGGEWGVQSGSMPIGSNVSGLDGSKTFDIPDGFYSGKTATANDAQLVAGNIRNGVNIFGIDGNQSVVNTSSGDATETDILKGKKAWVDGVEITGEAKPWAVTNIVPRTGDEYDDPCCTGEDGETQYGIEWVKEPGSGSHAAYTISSWAGVRFSDNGDGTVTDNLTGLIWLQNANCFEVGTWSEALSYANGLASGSCGLTDGSSAGDWRLPNANEMHSLMDLSQSGPALPPGHPFTNLKVWNPYHIYWSSTTCLHCTDTEDYAYFVNIWDGNVHPRLKEENDFNVWPVRGGQ